MKKLLLLSLVALATMFTSCSEGLDVNDPNEYCWKVTLTGYGVSETDYIYETSYVISQMNKTYNQSGYSFTYAKANDSQCIYNDVW